jgi:hypothetical protein
MTWRLKDIPRTVVVGETVWDIRFVRKIDDKRSAGKETVGLCNDDDKEICVRLGIGKREQAKTLIHELLHALEFEYQISIPHELVYKLEEPIYRLLCDNWNYFQE